MKKALLLIDIQNDFLPKGALGIPEANEILPWVHRLLQLPFDRKIASQDWHPKEHVSFVHLWPIHCVAGSQGAELAPPLHLVQFDRIIQKGTHPDVDSYSAFLITKDFIKPSWNNTYTKKRSTLFM